VIANTKTLLMAAGLALLLLASSDDGLAQQTEAPTGRLWVIGDSIAVGVSAALSRAGVAHLGSPETSTTARQWLGRIRGLDIVSGDVVVMSVGTNDWVSTELRPEFTNNMLRMMALMNARGARFVWLAPPSALVEDVELMPRPMRPQTIEDKSLPMADRWHPTAEGYERLAAQVRGVW
jgi:lysophospholipase L1-like esterase